MVVNKKAPPKGPSEEELRQELLDALQNESFSVLSLAYTYARTFSEYGEDVTTRWKNVALQTDALNRAYKKGWMDCIAHHGQKEKGND